MTSRSTRRRGGRTCRAGRARSSGRPSAAPDVIAGTRSPSVQLPEREDLQRDGSDVERLVAPAAGDRRDDHRDPGKGPPRRLVAAGIADEGQLQDIAAGRHVLDPERPIRAKGDGVLALAVEVILALGRLAKGIPPGRPLLVGQGSRAGRERQRRRLALETGKAADEVIHRDTRRECEPADDRPARAAKLEPHRLPGTTSIWVRFDSVWPSSWRTGR